MDNILADRALRVVIAFDDDGLDRVKFMLVTGIELNDVVLAIGRKVIALAEIDPAQLSGQAWTIGGPDRLLTVQPLALIPQCLEDN